MEKRTERIDGWMVTAVAVLLVLVLVLATVLLASCGGASGETGESATNSFVGDWEVVHSNGWGGQIAAGNLVVFRPDGTMNVGKDAGRYEVQEDGRARVMLPDETVFAYPPVGGELRLEREVYGTIQAATLRPYEELPITRENLAGTAWEPVYSVGIGTGHPDEISFTADGAVKRDPQSNCTLDETSAAILWCDPDALYAGMDDEQVRLEITHLSRRFMDITEPESDTVYRYRTP